MMLKRQTESEVTMIMAYSPELARLLQDATGGIPRKEIVKRLQKRGISPATWDRAKLDGQVPSVEKLVEIAEELELPTERVLAAARGGDVQEEDAFRLIQVGLEMLGLRPPSRLEVMELVRAKIGVDQAGLNRTAA